MRNLGESIPSQLELLGSSEIDCANAAPVRNVRTEMNFIAVIEVLRD